MLEHLAGPALDILKDLASGTAGPLTIGKASLEAWSAYNQRQELEALREFVEMLAMITGDIRQLLSDPYLQTTEGQRFAHKIVAAAVDAKLAEKRQLFANALVNGIHQKDTAELDRLRFVDLVIQLSAASLVKLAEIHKRCEPALVEKMGNPEWECVGLYPDGQLQQSIAPDSNVHFNAATLRELKSAGVLGKVRYAKRADGALKAVTVSTEANYYNAFTRAFARFISAPASKTA